MKKFSFTPLVSAFALFVLGFGMAGFGSSEAKDSVNHATEIEFWTLVAVIVAAVCWKALKSMLKYMPMRSFRWRKLVVTLGLAVVLAVGPLVVLILESQVSIPPNLKRISNVVGFYLMVLGALTKYQELLSGIKRAKELFRNNGKETNAKE